MKLYSVNVNTVLYIAFLLDTPRTAEHVKRCNTMTNKLILTQMKCINKRLKLKNYIWVGSYKAK